MGNAQEYDWVPVEEAKPSQEYDWVPVEEPDAEPEQPATGWVWESVSLPDMHGSPGPEPEGAALANEIGPGVPGGWKDKKAGPLAGTGSVFEGVAEPVKLQGHPTRKQLILSGRLKAGARNPEGRYIQQGEREISGLQDGRTKLEQGEISWGDTIKTALKEGGKIVRRSYPAAAEGFVEKMKAADIQELKLLGYTDEEIEAYKQGGDLPPPRIKSWWEDPVNNYRAFLRKYVPGDYQDMERVSNFLEDWRKSEGLRADEQFAELMHQTGGMKQFASEVFQAGPQLVSHLATAFVAKHPGVALNVLAQVTGMSYESLSEQYPDADKSRVFEAAFANAMMQLPMEALSVSKLTGVFKTRGRVLNKILKLVEAGQTEAVTEYFQAYPEKLAELYAAQPDAQTLLDVEGFVDGVSTGRFQRQAARQGAVGYVAGLAAGAPGVVASTVETPGKLDATQELLQNPYEEAKRAQESDQATAGEHGDVQPSGPVQPGGPGAASAPGGDQRTRLGERGPGPGGQADASGAQAQAAEPGPTIPEGRQGHGIDIRVPDPKVGRIPARYAVMELDEIQASHLPDRSFQKNPAYPYANERNYHSSPDEQAKVLRRSQPGGDEPFDAAFLLGESLDAIHGAPVTDKHGNVLGGNSRTMILDLVYSRSPESAAGYKARLAAQAGTYGLDPETVAGMVRPVLVRVADVDVSDPKAAGKIISMLNDDFAQARDAAGETASRAAWVSPRSYEILADGMEGHNTLREYLDTAGSRRLVDSLVDDGAIPQTERNKYVAAEGTLNLEGREYVEKLLRGVVIQEHDLQRTLPASAMGKIDRALPFIVRVKVRGRDWDMAPEFVQSVRMVDMFHKSKSVENLQQFFGVASMTDPADVAEAKGDPLVRILAYALEHMKPTDFEKAWRRYAHHAGMEASGRMALTGMEVPWGKAVKEFATTQAGEGLFKQAAARRAQGQGLSEQATQWDWEPVQEEADGGANAPEWAEAGAGEGVVWKPVEEAGVYDFETSFPEPTEDAVFAGRLQREFGEDSLTQEENAFVHEEFINERMGELEALAGLRERAKDGRDPRTGKSPRAEHVKERNKKGAADEIAKLEQFIDDAYGGYTDIFGHEAGERLRRHVEGMRADMAGEEARIQAGAEHLDRVIAQNEREAKILGAAKEDHRFNTLYTQGAELAGQALEFLETRGHAPDGGMQEAQRLHGDQPAKAVHSRLSGLAGSLSRMAKGVNALRKGHKKASKERVERDIELVKENIGELETALSQGREAPKREAEPKRADGEKAQAPERPPKDDESMEAALYGSLHSMGEAEKRWAKRRETGLTDAELKEAIAYEFGEYGGSTAHGWYDYWGGKNPRFKHKASNTELKGKKLVDKVRKYMRIPKPGDTEPRFMAGNGQGRGVALEELQRFADQANANQGNGAPVKAIADMTRAPERVRDKWEAGRGPRGVSGFYDPVTDTVYLVASGIRDAGQAGRAWLEGELARAVKHEQGHAGLPGFFEHLYGDKGLQEAERFLKHVYLAYGPDGLAHVAESHGYNLSNPKDRLLAAEEKFIQVLERANAGETITAKDKSLWRKFVDLVKKILRDLGGMKLKDTEIEAMARDLATWLAGRARGTGRGRTAGEAGYRSAPRFSGERKSPGEPLPSAMEMPELVHLAKELMAGRYPEVRKKLRGRAVGHFIGVDPGKIRVQADLFQNERLAREVLAHEIGHLVDWLPDKSLKRGNILGRIASLRNYLKHWMEGRPGGEGPLTDAEKARIRREVQRLATETSERWVDEEIVKNLPITPEDVLAIWNSVDTTRTEPGLYEYIAGLSGAEKKSIVKEAMRGMVREDLQRFAKEVREKTGRRVKKTVKKQAMSDEEIRAEAGRRIRKEITKRALLERDAVTAELKAFTQKWHPFSEGADPAYTKYRYSSKELYADALSGLLVDPALLKQTAPTFWHGFFNYVERKAEVKALYDEIQTDIRSGAAMDKRVKRLREGFAKGERAHAEAANRDMGGIMARDAWGNTFIDRHFAVLRRVKNVGEDNLPPALNPRYRIEDWQHVGTVLEGYLTDVKHEVLGPLAKAGLTVEDLGEWMFHARVAGERAGLANPQGWTAEASQARLAEMREHSGDELTRLAGRFAEVRLDLVAKPLADSGMYGAQLMDTILDNEAYATFDVIKFMEERYGKGLSGHIHGQTGTLSDVANPLAATIAKDLALMKAVNRNNAARAVVRFLRRYHGEDIRAAKTEWRGRYQAPVDPADPDLGLLAWMERGQVKGVYVPKYVAESFQRNPVEGWLIADILRVTGKPFKAVFVDVNPGFWLFNMARDYKRSVRNLQGATLLNFAPYYLKGIRPAFRSVFGIPDPVVRAMLDKKELISVADYRGRNRDDTQTERMLKRYNVSQAAWEEGAARPFQALWYFLGNIGRGIERVPKVGAKLYLDQRFPDMHPDVKSHIIRSQAGSPDFLRQGTGSPIYNNLLFFANAIKEGWRGDWEAARTRPLEYAWKAAKYNFIPKMLMYAMGLGLAGAWSKAVMDRATDYDKTNYIVVPLGLTETGKGVYLRVPQDETGRFLGGVFWKLLQGDKDTLWTSLFDYMAGQAPTVHPMITALGAVVQYASGRNPYDVFRGRNVIPDLVFTAGGAEKHEHFARWLADHMGAGIVHRFGSDRPGEIQTELEKVLGFPFVSNIAGRFIKVTDHGIAQELREAKMEVRRARARDTLRLRKIVEQWVAGEEPELSADDRRIIQERIKAIPEYMMKAMAFRYGDAVVEEIVSAQSRDEVEAVLARLREINQVKKLEE